MNTLKSLLLFVVRVCYLSWLGVQFQRDIGSWVSWIAWTLLAVNIFWFSQQVSLLINYKEENVGRVGVNLCKTAVEKAWKDPDFLADQHPSAVRRAAKKRARL